MVKKVLKWMAVSLVAIAMTGRAEDSKWTDASGWEWTYQIVDDSAVVTGCGLSKLISDASGDITVPDVLGDFPVTTIGGDGRVFNSPAIISISFPASIENVCTNAFGNKCLSVTRLFFMGDMPEFEEGWKTDKVPSTNDCVIAVSADSRNWSDGGGKVDIPGYWQGFRIERDTLNPLLTCGFNPPSGTSFVDSLDVVITNAEVAKVSDVEIRYTLDGSDPTTNSALFSGKIVLSEASTIKCCAFYAKNEIVYHGPVAGAKYFAPLPDGGPYNETVSGLDWTFIVRKGESLITRASHEEPAVPVTTEGALELPALLGGRPVTGVDVSAFERCRYLTEVSFPASVRRVASFAFRDCLRLTNLVYQGEAPVFDLAALKDAPVGSPVVKPSSHTNYINVAVEVQGDVVGVPDSWLEELAIRYGEGNAAAYTNAFVAVFGDDFAAALLKPSGKIDLIGNALMVWQDYVAGTNPLDGDDYFRAGIEMTELGPVISWAPVLTEAEAARRIYTIWGAATLGAATTVWKDVSALTPAQLVEKGYRFFKVTVKMAEEAAPPDETPPSEEETPPEPAP